MVAERKRAKGTPVAGNRKDSTSSRGSVESEQPSARATRSSARLRQKRADSIDTEETPAQEYDVTPKAPVRSRRSRAQVQKKKVIEQAESSDAGSVESAPHNMLADAHTLVDFSSSASSQSKNAASKPPNKSGKRNTAASKSNRTPNQVASNGSTITAGPGERDTEERDTQPSANESDGSGDSVELLSNSEAKKPAADIHEEHSVHEAEDPTNEQIHGVSPAISPMNPLSVEVAIQNINGESMNNNNEHPSFTQETPIATDEDCERSPELSAVEAINNYEFDKETEEHMNDNPPRIVKEEPDEDEIPNEQQTQPYNGDQKPFGKRVVEEPPEEPSERTETDVGSSVREDLSQWPPGSYSGEEPSEPVRAVRVLKVEEEEEPPVPQVTVNEEPRPQPVDTKIFKNFSMQLKPRQIDIRPPPPPTTPPPPVKNIVGLPVVVETEKERPQVAKVVVKTEPQDVKPLAPVTPKPLPVIANRRLMEELQRLTQQIAYEKQLQHTPAVSQPTEEVDPAERWKEMAQLWQKTAEESRIQLQQAELAAREIRHNQEVEAKKRQEDAIEQAKSKATALFEAYAKEHEKEIETKTEEGHGKEKEAGNNRIGEERPHTPHQKPVLHADKTPDSKEKKTPDSKEKAVAVSAKKTESASHSRRSRSKSPANRRDKHRRSHSRDRKHVSNHSRDKKRSRSRSRDSHRRRHSRSRSPRHRNHSDHHHRHGHGKKDEHFRHPKSPKSHRRRHSRSPDRSTDRKGHGRKASRSRSCSRSPPDSPVASKQVSPKETKPVPEKMQEIPLPPPSAEPTPEMPPFEEIETLIYLDDKVLKNGKKVKRAKESSIACDCKKNGLDCSDNRCVNREMLYECGPRCTLGDQCKNQRFSKREYADVAPFYTGPQKGWGVRAKTLIRKDDFIIEYIGEVVTAEQFLNRSKAYAKDPKHKHHYIFELGSKLIDATVKGNCSRFINHSCAPNAVCLKWAVPRSPTDVSRIGFFATRDILPGEEITFDYQFLNFGKKAQPCHCGAATCKGIIGKEVPEEGESDDELEDEVEEPEADDDEKTEEERIQQEFEKEEEREYLAQKRITSIISSAIPRSKMAKKAQIMVRDLMHVDESNFKLRVLSFLEHSDTFYQVLKRSNVYDVFASWLSPVDWSRHDMELKLGVFRLISNQDAVDKTIGWTASCCQAVENLATMKLPDVLAIRGAIDSLLDEIAGPMEVDIDPDSDHDPLAELSNEELFLAVQKEAKKICRANFEDVKRSCAVTKFKIPKKVTVERAEAGKDPGSTHEYTAELRRFNRKDHSQGFNNRTNNNHFRGNRHYNNRYCDRPRYFGRYAPVRYFNEPNYFNDDKYGKRKYSYMDRDRRSDHSYDNYQREDPRPDSRGSIDAKRPRINRFDMPPRSPVRERPPQPMLLDPVTGRPFEPVPVHEPVDMEIDRDSPSSATMDMETPQRDVPTPMTMASTDQRASSTMSMPLVTPPKDQATPAIDYTTPIWQYTMASLNLPSAGPHPNVAVVAPNPHLSLAEQKISDYIALPDDMFKFMRAHMEQELQYMALADEKRTIKAAAAAKAKADEVRRTVPGAQSLQPPPPPKKKSRWCRVLDSEGTPYYYHKETKETTWDLPEGETCDETESGVVQQEEAEPDSSSNVEESRPDLGARLADLMSQPSTVDRPSSRTESRVGSRAEQHQLYSAARVEARLKEFKTAVEEEVQPSIFRYLQDFPSSQEKKMWMVKRVAREMTKRESLREDFDYRIHSAGRTRILHYTQKFMDRKTANGGKDLWKGYEH